MQLPLNLLGQTQLWRAPEARRDQHRGAPREHDGQHASRARHSHGKGHGRQSTQIDGRYEPERIQSGHAARLRHYAPGHCRLRHTAARHAWRRRAVIAPVCDCDETGRRHSPAADDHDRHGTRSRISSQQLAERKTVHVGHVEVAHDRVRHPQAQTTTASTPSSARSTSIPARRRRPANRSRIAAWSSTTRTNGMRAAESIACSPHSIWAVWHWTWARLPTACHVSHCRGPDVSAEQRCAPLVVHNGTDVSARRAHACLWVGG
jgi:hypothetical protein